MRGKRFARNPDYFQLRSGLDRALYRIARKMAGNQRSGFEVGFEDIRSRCGSDQEARYCRRELRTAIERNVLPDYWIAQEINQDGKPALRMIRRDFSFVDKAVDKK